MVTVKQSQDTNFRKNEIMEHFAILKLKKTGEEPVDH